MNENSLATILLVSRLCDEGVEPLNGTAYWSLREQIRYPRELLECNEAKLFEDYGLSGEFAARIVRLFDRARAMAFKLDGLKQSGISTLTPFDDRYPKRFVKQLGNKAPALLYATGNLDLLERPALGVVGSRDVSDHGATVAKDAGEQAAQLGYVLVSGGARGVDQLAMNAAFEAGGTIVGILADSLLRRLKAPDVRRAIHEERAVMCTPYSPDAPFSRGNAMGRNKLVYALSRVTLVVASADSSGGTWTGAIEALKQQSGCVGVWRGAGQGPGNEQLIENGALAIPSITSLQSAVTALSATDDIEATIEAIDDRAAALTALKTIDDRLTAATAETWKLAMLRTRCLEAIDKCEVALAIDKDFQATEPDTIENQSMPGSDPNDDQTSKRDDPREEQTAQTGAGDNADKRKCAENQSTQASNEGATIPKDRESVDDSNEAAITDGGSTAAEPDTAEEQTTPSGDTTDHQASKRDDPREEQTAQTDAGDNADKRKPAETQPKQTDQQSLEI